MLPYVKQPGAPIYTRSSFVVEARNPGLADTQAVQGTRSSSTAIESDVERIRAQREAARRRCQNPRAERPRWGRDVCRPLLDLPDDPEGLDDLLLGGEVGVAEEHRLDENNVGAVLGEGRYGLECGPGVPAV